jgi:hypothetical protein
MTKRQAESKLVQLVTESWSRVRSSYELNALITRRELALADVEID